MIQATCGHKVSDAWCASRESSVAVAIHDRDGSRAVSYRIVCPKCFIDHERVGDLLTSDAAQLDWLAGNNIPASDEGENYEHENQSGE